jgi:hypothetical protein
VLDADLFGARRPEGQWFKHPYYKGEPLHVGRRVESAYLGISGLYHGIDWASANADDSEANDHHRVIIHRAELVESTGGYAISSDTYYAWQWGIEGRLIRWVGSKIEEWSDGNPES